MLKRRLLFDSVSDEWSCQSMAELETVDAVLEWLRSLIISVLSWEIETVSRPNTDTVILATIKFWEIFSTMNRVPLHRR